MDKWPCLFWRIIWRYRTAKGDVRTVAVFNLLGEKEAAKEKTCREGFARTYKEWTGMKP